MPEYPLKKPLPAGEGRAQVGPWFPGSTIQIHEAHRWLAYDTPPEGLEIPGSDEWCAAYE